MKQWLTLALLATACGEDGGPGMSPDAPGGSPQTITITHRANRLPDLLAYQDGAGAWQPLAADATSFVVESGRYRLAAVCAYASSTGDAPRVFASSVARAVSEAVEVAVPCGRTTVPTPVEYARVEGTVAEPGEVTMDVGYATSPDPNWAFDFEVAVGPQVLLAADPERLVVRRLEIAAATTLPPISLASEGMPWAHATIELDGTDNDDTEVWWDSSLDLGPTFWYAYDTSLDTSSARVPYAPDALLQDGDLRYLTVTAEYATGWRSVFLYDYDASLPDRFTLPPKLTGVTREGRAARWSELPPIDEARLSLFDGDTGRYEYAFATSGWLADATSLALDFGDIPGWDPAWDASVDGLELRFDVSQRPDERIYLDSGVTLAMP